MRMAVAAFQCSLFEVDSVRRVCGRLRNWCMRTWKTLVEMAQSVEMSPPHFARMFRKSTGETPHQFVLRNRIERGKEMLCTPRVRILDVAVACGFKTQQHFARVFRRLCGTSPREYQLERWSSDPSEQRRNRNPRIELALLLQ